MANKANTQKKQTTSIARRTKVSTIDTAARGELPLVVITRPEESKVHREIRDLARRRLHAGVAEVLETTRQLYAAADEARAALEEAA